MADLEVFRRIHDTEGNMQAMEYFINATAESTLARQAGDLTITGTDRAELTALLDGYADDIEADIIAHCIIDESRDGEPMPEDAGYVARQRVLWKQVQGWMRRLEVPAE